MQSQHNPVVIIPGGPGLPHDYLETLEGAAMEDRVVLLFDPVGTGNSSALPSVDAAADSPNLLGTVSLVAQVMLGVRCQSLRKICTYSSCFSGHERRRENPAGGCFWGRFFGASWNSLA